MQDVLNNSAWNYRFHAVCQLDRDPDGTLPLAVLLREIDFAFVRIAFAIDNDSSWCETWQPSTQSLRALWC